MPRNASTPVISAKICMALNSYKLAIIDKYKTVFEEKSNLLYVYTGSKL